MGKNNALWKFAPAMVLLVIFLLTIVFAMYIRNLLADKEPQKRKMIQQITVITPPPPPPPPPPEEIPEPEVQEEIVEQEPDEPQPEEAAEAPPSQDLGLDAEGSAGGDGFGLVARKGGTGLLAGGGYGAYMRTELQKALMADKRLKHLEYRALVKVWFDEQGQIAKTDVELLNGESSVRRLLESFLVDFPRQIKNKPLEAQETYYELRVSSLI